MRNNRPKTSRCEIPVPIKRLGTTLCEIDGNSVRKAARIVKISYNRLSEIRNKAVEAAKENDRPLDADENYENDPEHHRGPRHFYTQQEGDKICERIVSSPENRRKTSAQLRNDLELSCSISCLNQLMYNRGYSRKLSGWKPRLSKQQRDARRRFAKKYGEYNWRKAIFLDEVSIRKAEHRRERTWQAKKETFHKDVKQEKAESDEYSMGMMFGAIRYNYRGPNAFFFKETDEEREHLDALIEQENQDMEHMSHMMFFAERATAEHTYEQEKGRRMGGAFPKWETYWEKHKMKRGDRSKGGIDWIRYRETALRRLMPFAVAARADCGEVFVCEDGAPPYSPRWIAEFYHKWQVLKLLDWPANSPDLNPIEKAWDWCRKWIFDNRFSADNEEEAQEIWEKAWNALPIKKINEWIDAVPGIL